MELVDLLQDISATEMAFSGTAGLVVGAIVGLFDKKEPTSEDMKGALSIGSSVPCLNLEGTLGSNMAEALANIGSARVGFEIGYQGVQRFVYKNYY